MQIKTTVMRYYFIPAQMTIIKKTGTMCWRGRKGNPYALFVGM